MSIKHTRFPSLIVVHNESGDVLSPEQTKLTMDFLKNQDLTFFDNIKWVAYDCSLASNISPSAIPVLCRLSVQLEQQGVKFSIICSPKTYAAITKQGIERMVNPYPSLETFSTATGLAQNINKDNARIFLNTTIDSVMLSIKMMLETEVTSNNIRIVDANSTMPDLQVGAIASIVSTYFNGNLVLGFSNDVFKKAMSKFLQMEVTEITPVIKDGAAELLNVIIGQTKIVLNEKGFAIQQVIPSVLSGEKINVFPPSKQKAILIENVCDFGKFYLILSTNTSN